MSLYQELKNFRRRDQISFHIPGHKGGNGLNPAWKQDAFSLDVTEFDETDDLQRPTGILKTAQEAAAQAFGAGTSFFLTNGSSLGLQAAILSSCRPGTKLLVDRTCHKSVVSGMILSGAEPIFLSPRFDDERELYTGFSAAQVADALEQNPDIPGFLLTSPTYYGICSDIREIAALLHSRGKFLIVDEAHGAHFCFHSLFPDSTLSQGADLVIQSAHKTLPALGQCSLLHVHKNSLISAKDVSAALRLLQTTSPSYLLMSSMDEAIAMMRQHPAMPPLLDEIMQLKQAVRKQGILDFADTQTLECPQDPLRLTVDFRRAGCSGQDAAELLKQHYGIYPEMADSRYVVLIVTVSNTVKELSALKDALLALAVSPKTSHGAPIPAAPLPMPKLVLSPREAWLSPRKTVPLSHALGKTAAEIVSVCPPGAALVVPGQRIDQAVLDALTAAKITKTLEITES